MLRISFVIGYFVVRHFPVAGPGVAPGSPGSCDAVEPTPSAQLQAPESNRARRAYETQLGTCRVCNLSVTKGRVELPCPKGTTF